MHATNALRTAGSDAGRGVGCRKAAAKRGRLKWLLHLDASGSCARTAQERQTQVAPTDASRSRGQRTVVNAPWSTPWSTPLAVNAPGANTGTLQQSMMQPAPTHAHHKLAPTHALPHTHTGSVEDAESQRYTRAGPRACTPARPRSLTGTDRRKRARPQKCCAPA